MDRWQRVSGEHYGGAARLSLSKPVAFASLYLLCLTLLLLAATIFLYLSLVSRKDGSAAALVHVHRHLRVVRASGCAFR
jgi:hypothetical protein